jgi:polyhydroxyalkanoate synthesis repressor PhaR
MSEPRVIKRYSNRKLYDTQSSQYVTLEQIAQMIRIGEEVRVLDNSTKEDLTSVTLAQIIFEEEKRQKSFIPLGAMRQLIQTGGASLQELAQQAQARVMSVFRKGDPEEGQAPVEPEPEPLRDARKLAAEAGHPVRDLIDRSQQTIDEWQRRVDDRVRQFLDHLSPFAALQKEVAELSERVETLEKLLAARSLGASGSPSVDADASGPAAPKQD